MVSQRISLPTNIRDCSYEQQRQQLINDLEELIWQDVDAICQLEDFCLNRQDTIDDRAKNLLIKKNILNEDGTLPDITNEAMYELRTGEKPFWLKNGRP